jgi:hypothetical protein
MKTNTICSLALAAMLGVTSIHVTRADTAEATCEVRKDGEKQGGKSGPCTFGQRQGYIDIDLKNGDSISLSPADEANQYRDQQGNKVVRTMQGQDHVYQWPNKKITVRFTGISTSTTRSTSGGAGNLQDMVNGRWVGAEVADELARRGYTSVRDEVAGGYVTSHYKGHGQCVIVNLDTDKRVTSVDEGPGC